MPTRPATAAEPFVDLVGLAAHDRHLWDAGWHFGYLAGHEAGVRWADDRAATLHREAVRVVRKMAGVPDAPPPSPAREAERDRLTRGPVR